MVLALIAAAVFAREPEDVNELYRPDMQWATYVSWEELAYDSSVTAFRTIQGCLDLQRWYMRYDAKFRASLYRGFGLRYRYARVDDYGARFGVHRFEPFLRVAPRLYAHLYVQPEYLKLGDEAGLGLSWYADPLNYLECFLGVVDFDNNFSHMHTRYGPELDVYDRFPVRLALNAAHHFGWGRFRLEAYRLLPAVMELKDPDQGWIRRFSSYAAAGRVDFFPHHLLGLGVAGQVSGRGERTKEAGIGVRTDTLTALEIEPWLELNPGGRFGLRARQAWTYKWHNAYRRTWHGPEVMGIFGLNPSVVFGLGYQASWRVYSMSGVRQPSDYYDNHHRAVLLAEFHFGTRGYLWIREGIELDGFPTTTLHSPHNHTYAAIFVRL